MYTSKLFSSHVCVGLTLFARPDFLPFIGLTGTHFLCFLSALSVTGYYYFHSSTKTGFT
jgi:hypothetical protein